MRKWTTRALFLAVCACVVTLATAAHPQTGDPRTLTADDLAFAPDVLQDDLAAPNPTMYVLTGNSPELIRAYNPDVATVHGARAGGLDAGLPGDAKGFLLGSGQIPKGYYRSNDAIEFELDSRQASEDLTVEFDYMTYDHGSRRCRISWNDLLVAQMDLYADEQSWHAARFVVPLWYLRQQPRHVLTIEETHRLYVTMDAVRFSGEGIRYVMPGGGVLSREDVAAAQRSKVPGLPRRWRLPRGSRAFDFGPPDSPVWEDGGFTAVSAADRYDPERGYGWRDRGGVLADGILGAQYPVLQRDYVEGRSAAEGGLRVRFEVDVPNGPYSLLFIIGGAAWPEESGSPVIRAEGTLVPLNSSLKAQDAVLGWSSMHYRGLRTEVEDGRLSIDITGDYFLLNGLAVIPARSHAAAQRLERALLEAYYLPVCSLAEDPREVEFANLPEERLESEVDARGGTRAERTSYIPSQADRERGHIAFCPDYQDDLFPGALPEPEQTSIRAELQATPGEREPIVLAIRPLRDLAQCDVVCSDLVGSGGVIPAAHCDVRSVMFGPLSWTTSVKGQYRIGPQALVHTGPSRLADGRTAFWWATIHVPDNARPGRYEGQLTFTARDAEACSVEVVLDVLPFRLASPPNRHVGFFWSPAGYLMDPETSIEQQFEDMQRHGVTGLQSYGFGARFVPRADGGCEYDFTAFDRLVRLKRRYGIVGPIPVFKAWHQVAQTLGVEIRSEAFEAGVADFYGAAWAEAKRRGWPEIYFYPWDEPGGDALETTKYLCELIKRVVPEAKTFITCADHSAQVLDDWLDVRCYASLTEQRVAETRAAGDVPFEYGGVYGGSAFQLRYNCGFRFWKTGAVGKYMWVYAWAKGNPWFDLDNTMRETGAVYPGEDVPIPIPAYEGVREGVDDLRYVYTLRQAIDDALASKDPEQVAAGRAAGERLGRILAPIGIDGPGELRGGDLDDARRQVAGLIVGLQ